MDGFTARVSASVWLRPMRTSLVLSRCFIKVLARNPGEFRIIRRTSLARTERLRDQCARLSLEPRLDANGRRCRRGPAGAAKWPTGGLLQMRRQMAEIAHVLRLLLAPDELRVPIGLQSGRQGIG